MDILNKELYAVLLDLFPDGVEIANEGERGGVTYALTNGKYYAETQDTGQEFRVNCPFCGDKRGRLFISYLVCADIRHRGRYVRTWQLMHCHNEGCNTQELYKQIRSRIKNPPAIDIKPSEAKARVNLSLPGRSYPINSPKAHKAPALYMKGRGFDLDELGVEYGVRTCDRIPEVSHLGQMIIFPYYDGAKLTFWQARLSHDPLPGTKVPKYYFPKGTHKSEVLYNRYKAMTQQMVVITEGVLDAIRIGPAGVAIFGKHPSVAQTRIMSRVFKRKMGVLMLDPDAEKEAEKWYRKYKGNVLFEKGLYLCRLADKDPADHTREEIWEKITECIAKGPE